MTDAPVADNGAELVVCGQLMMELAMDEQPLSYEGAVEAETLQANLAGFDRYCWKQFRRMKRSMCVAR